jgi:hypothetical protein
MSENLTYDKLKWNASDLGELKDKDFVLPLDTLLGTKDSEFKSNELYYIDIKGDKHSMKVSIFSYNDINVVIDKIKPDFKLPLMSYLVFSYNGNRYLMSRDYKDDYTRNHINLPYTRVYLTSIRKTLAFQWIFFIKCTNLDKTISRVYDIPTEFNIDRSHVVSCFETRYTISTKNDIELPRLMINKFFDKKDEYFLSTCQYLLCEGYTNKNLYIQKLRNLVIKEYKGDIYWFNKCLKRIEYILGLPYTEYERYPEMELLIPETM